jgi:hypothetical protein
MHLQSTFPGAAEPEICIDAERALSEADHQIRELLRQKSSEAKLTPVHQPGSKVDETDRRVTIPVVEQELLINDLEQAFAVLRHVRVEIHASMRTSGDDEVIIDQAFDVDGVQHRQMRLAVQGARRLLKSFAGIEHDGRVIVHCLFDEPNIIIGESLGVGLTFAVFVEFLRLLQYRELVALRSDVAMTGVVNTDGDILPVDEAGLRRKIETCAYDSVRFLVVPRAQEKIAQAVLNELAGVESLRPVLEIIGVARLDDILFDRRLTIVSRTSFGAHALRRARRHRVSVLLAASIVLPLLAVLIWAGPFDKNPLIGEFGQETLNIHNRSGELLGQIVVGGEAVANNAQAVALQRNCRPLAIADVTNDGQNEVFFVRSTQEDGGWTELVCQSGSSGEILWTYRLSRALTFGTNTRPLEYRFVINGLLVDDPDGDGQQEVILLASLRAFSPSMLVSLRARDGVETGSYLHIGRLNDVAIVDIDNDSTKEIVTCGINNAFRSASIAVFEYPRISGVSPSSLELRPKEAKTGTEEYYFLIPRSIVGEALRSQNFGSMGFRLGILRKNQLTVGVKDFEVYVPELGQKVEGVVTMTLQAGFVVSRVERNEGFDLTSEILYRKKRIARLPDDMYFAEFAEELRYWNGNKWSSKPTQVVESVQNDK